MDRLRYPIGKFEVPQQITDKHIEDWIEVLELFPTRLENLVNDLNDEQLNTPYRDGGWTVRQVVHHCADSHHNSYIRFKWALTEDTPIIKAYFEKNWAELIDAKHAPIDMSLNHLKAVHSKLVYLLKRLNPEHLHRSFIHPEKNSEVSLKQNIGQYAWHSNHHYAHIEELLKRKNWL